MNFSRRNFMRLGGVAAIAGIGMSKNAFSFELAHVLANQTCEGFRQYLGTEFQLSKDSSKFLATLTDIQEFPAASQNGECFSLEFSVKAKQVSQAIYYVYHPNFGNFQLFMTEGKIDKQPTLIAIINHI